MSDEKEEQKPEDNHEQVFSYGLGDQPGSVKATDYPGANGPVGFIRDCEAKLHEAAALAEQLDQTAVDYVSKRTHVVNILTDVSLYLHHVPSRL